MILVGDRWIDTGDAIEVRSPADGAVVGVVSAAAPEHVTAAVEAARGALAAPLPSFDRCRLLRALAERVAAARDELGRLIMRESGKPIGESRIEVDRAATTIDMAADEALRLGGEVLACDVTPARVDRRAVAVRVPVGVVAAITPFNFPINVLVHKLAPALAAGNAVVVKPAPRTPLTANRVGELALDAGWPAGWINIVHGGAEIATALAAADVDAISLTGGADAGRAVAAHGYGKRVLLELGGNDPVIVAADADLDAAADTIVAHRFGSAGQRCTSCKRVFAHRSRCDDLVVALEARIRALVVGDPADEATQIGPLISEDAAIRVERRIQAIVAAGATVRTGGTRDGAVVAPTLITGLDPLHPEALDETFGPVLPVFPYDDVGDAIAWTNAAPAGLQAGVFTDSLELIQRLFRELAVGTLVINDGPNFRIESLPFGGLKQGGSSREGVRFAVEEMTTLKTLVM